MGSPGQNPDNCKMVVVVVVAIIMGMWAVKLLQSSPPVLD